MATADQLRKLLIQTNRAQVAVGELVDAVTQEVASSTRYFDRAGDCLALAFDDLLEDHGRAVVREHLEAEALAQTAS